MSYYRNEDDQKKYIFKDLYYNLKTICTMNSYSLNKVVDNMIKKYLDFCIERQKYKYNSIVNDLEIIKKSIDVFKFFEYFKFVDESEQTFLKRVLDQLKIEKVEKDVINFLHVIINISFLIEQIITEDKIKEKEQEIHKDFLMTLKDKLGRYLCSIVLKC